jgi:hypothetical protein
MTIGTFADDTAIFASDEDPITGSSNLQEHLHLLEKWFNKWKIKANCATSTQTTFTLRKGTCPPVQINKTSIQQADQATYLGITLDSKLTWRPHILKKCKQMDLNWFIGKESCLSHSNKLLVYKTVIKRIWTYGFQLWGTACKSTVDIIQRAQSKLLRSITAAPWYISNRTCTQT